MAITADGVATNGLNPHEPTAAARLHPEAAPVVTTAPKADDGPLTSLRDRPINIHLFKGYGPLVVGAILFVLMVTLAPTVAPERIVEKPVNGTATEPADAPLEDDGISSTSTTTAVGATDGGTATTQVPADAPATEETP